MKRAQDYEKASVLEHVNTAQTNNTSSRKLFDAENIIKGCESRANNMVCGLADFGNSLPGDYSKFKIQELELAVKRLVEELNKKD